MARVRRSASPALAGLLATSVLCACDVPFSINVPTPDGGTSVDGSIPDAAATCSGASPFTTDISFAPASDSFDSSKVTIANGEASLMPASQTDDVANGFGGGTLQGAIFDQAMGGVRIDTGTAGSQLDASWTPQWSKLVGYWTLDGSGAIANGAKVPATGGHTDGVAINPSGAGLAYGAGRVNGAMQFTGVIGEGVVASSLPDNGGAAGTAIALWFYPNSSSTNQLLFADYIGALNGQDGVLADFGDNSDDNLWCYLGFSGIWTGASIPRRDVALNRWHHLVCSWDGSTVTLYLDDAVAATAAVVGTIASGTGTGNIGMSSDAPGTYSFSGAIDDVAFWSTSLSATDVDAIYSRQAPRYSNTSALDASWTPQWSRLIGYWTLDGSGPVADGATIPAAVGPGGEARNANGQGMAYRPGRIGRAIALDGVDDYVAVDDIPAFSGMSQLTLSAWVRLAAFTTSDGQVVFIKNTFDPDPPALPPLPYQTWGLWISNTSNGDPVFEVSSTSNTRYLADATNVHLDLGTWHHLVGTYDGSSASLYVDGALATQLAIGPITLASSNEAPFIGAFRGSPGYANNLIGSVDEVAIWNVALSAAEIRRIFDRQSVSFSGTFTSRVMDAGAWGAGLAPWTSLDWRTTLPFFKELPGTASETNAGYPALAGSGLASGLMGLWHFDEAAGSVAVVDSSGRSTPGTPVGGVALGAAGRFGRAATFDGNDSYVEITDDGALSPTGSAMTVAAWVNVPPVVTGGCVVNKYAMDTTDDQYVFAIWPGGVLDFVWHTTGSDTWGTPSSNEVQSRGTIEFDKWTHIVAVRDGPTVSFYIDGEAAGSSSPADANPFHAGSATLRLGGMARGGVHRNMTGAADEIALWNRALSQAEISQLYRRGANRIGLQLRSCSSAGCSDAAWSGPDGSNQTWFSELDNLSAAAVLATPPALDFSAFTGLTIPPNRYFQYRAVLESDDEGGSCNYGSANAPCSPELASVTAAPVHYDASSPTVTALGGVPFCSLSSFAVTLGTDGCAGAPTFQLSIDQATWYHWSAAAGSWAVAAVDPAQASAEADIDAHLADFANQVGTGSLFVRTFLGSIGTAPCSVDGLAIGGMR